MERRNSHTVKRILFPTELARQVIRVCKRRKCSFSDFTQEAVEQALEELHNQRSQEA